MSLRDLNETLDQLRQQAAVMRPKECCTKELMIAAGVATWMCSEHCQWQKLDLLIATAMAEVPEPPET